MRKLTRSGWRLGGTSLVATLLLSACAPSDTVGVARAPIYDGTIERDEPAVVLVADASGICTGTLIGPRLVLTAKHCVRGEGDTAIDPATLSVYIGPSSSEVNDVLSVREIRVAPGTWNVTDGTDIALLLLSETSTVTPIEVSFDEPIELESQNITILGYGLDENDQAGLKRRLETTVLDVYGPHVYLPRGACAGDSGGPLLGEDGKVWAVTSHGPRDCNFGSTYVSVHGFRDLIEDAMLDSRECTPSEETCNGVDDDCDGEADEGCVALGSACSSDDECAGERCSTTPAGRICSQACDPLSPRSGCPGGFYCAHVGGCEGACVPMPAARADCGSVDCLGGNRAVGGACDEDSDCASRLCLEGRDGSHYCASACTGNAGMCLSGEVCAAAEGECGGCIAAEDSLLPRGRGETCRKDADCASNSCLTSGESSYCTSACEADRDCGSAFHCGDGLCLRGPREAMGGPCASDADCRSDALCLSHAGAKLCASSCVDGTCPPGYGCTDVEGEPMCVPERRIVGESCENNEDCHTGLCAHAANGSACTRFCGPESPCGAGFECIRIGDGTSGACIAPSLAEYEEGTCSVARPGGKHSAWWLGALVAIALVRRRRR